MQTVDFKLDDASGGLNLDKHPSQLKKNELSRLYNIITDEGGWPGKKRFGQLLLQLGPIDPQESAVDANTLATYRLDDASNSILFADGTTVADLGVYGSANYRVTGLLPQSGPLGQKFFAPSQATTAPSIGFDYSAGEIWPLDGKAACTFQGWVKVGAGFSGAPINLTSVPGGTPYTTYQTGSPLFATTQAPGPPAPYPSIDILNGVTLHRDWDPVSGSDVGDPYVIFTLRTSGISGTVTRLRSGAIPVGSWVHVRCVYDSATGKMEIYLTGDPSTEAIVPGAGPIENVQTAGFHGALLGGGWDTSIPLPGLQYAMRSGDFELDDVEIADVARTGFPFRRLRGNLFPYEKADGSGYIVGAAGDGLFSTVLDGSWQVMATGLNSVAYWCASQVNDLLYLSNGVDPPRNWDGTTLRKTGPPTTAPTTAAVVIAGAGPGAATYEYATTFFFGEAETGLGPASTPLAVIANRGVDITDIELGNVACTARGIYRRRTADPSDDWRLIRKINDNTTTALNVAWTNNSSPYKDTGRDELPYASTGVGTAYPPIRATVYTSIMPKAAYLTTLHRRLFMIADPDRPYDLIWSEIDAPDVVRVFSYVRSSTSNGALIGMSPYYNELHVSEGGNSTLVLRGDGPNNWRSLATLHPTLGCVDHFAFVHRTIPGTDRYELCFPAKDGFYRYRGYNFERISENINPLIDTLASFQIRKGAFLTTTQADFQAGPAGVGSATDNVWQPIYGTDGTRQLADQLGLVNQLDDMPLWRPSAPIVGGKITFVCKGEAEGEFFFGTTADNELRRTTNNFKTASIVPGTPLGAGERVIEIVRKGTAEEYFILTDTANGTESDGGYIYKWDQAGGAWSTINNTDKNYYISDTLFRVNGVTGGANGRLYSLYMDKLEKPELFNPTSSPTTKIAALYQYASLTAPGSSAYYGDFTVPNNGSLRIGPYGNYLGVSDNYFGYVELTIRKQAKWLGGVVRPQAIWDGAKLVFSSYSADDGNKQRTGAVYSIADAPASPRVVIIAATRTSYALCQVGASIYVTYSTKNSDGSGFTTRLYTINGSYAVALVGVCSVNKIVTRLSYNANTNKLLCGGTTHLYNTYGGFAPARPAYDTQNRKGFLGSMAVATGAITELTLTTAYPSGAAGVVEPGEITYQTTAPYPHFITNTITTGQPWVLGQVNAAHTVVTPRKSTAPVTGVTGMPSNLLFVPQSGSTGNYLWSDRLYYYCDAPQGVLNQLGVDGVWEIRGSYSSQYYQASSIGAFGSFDSEFNGSVAFRMRNGTLMTIGAAAYQGIVANANVNNFPVPDNVVQWGSDFVWQYDYNTPTTYPYINFVQVNYYSDDIQVPRMIGWHWKGRSYWSVARAGQNDNDLVVVYQKDNTWTTYEGWNIAGICIFRGRLISPQFYNLVELEKGLTDLGNRINDFALSGAIMDDRSDKCLRDVNVNQMSFVNPGFPTRNGWCKIIPYGAGIPMAQAQFLAPILATTNPAPRQVKAFQPNTAAGQPFIKAYTRTLQIAYMTSDEAPGSIYEAWYAQPETISAVLIKMFVSHQRYRIASV